LRHLSNIASINQKARRRIFRCVRNHHASATSDVLILPRGEDNYVIDARFTDRAEKTSIGADHRCARCFTRPDAGRRRRNRTGLCLERAAAEKDPRHGPAPTAARRRGFFLVATDAERRCLPKSDTRSAPQQAPPAPHCPRVQCYRAAVKPSRGCRTRGPRQKCSSRVHATADMKSASTVRASVSARRDGGGTAPDIFDFREAARLRNCLPSRPIRLELVVRSHQADDVAARSAGQGGPSLPRLASWIWRRAPGRSACRLSLSDKWLSAHRRRSAGGTNWAVTSLTRMANATQPPGGRYETSPMIPRLPRSERAV